MRSGTFQFLEVLQGITATEELTAQLFLPLGEFLLFYPWYQWSGCAVCVLSFPFQQGHGETGTHQKNKTARKLCNWSSRKGWKPRIFNLQGRNLKRSLIGLKHTEFLRNSTWWCEAFQGIPPLRTKHREAHETAAAESCRNQRKLPRSRES